MTRIEELKKRIRQQDAELVGIGRCCAAIVRDLRASGHDEAARMFEQQVEASRWTIAEVERELAELEQMRGAVAHAARDIAELQEALREHLDAQAGGMQDRIARNLFCECPKNGHAHAADCPLIGGST